MSAPSTPFDDLDPVGFIRSLVAAGTSAAAHPDASGAAWIRYLARSALVGPTAVARQLGAEVDDVAPVPTHDHRFGEAAWTSLVPYHMLQQQYLLQGDLVLDLIDAADLDPAVRRKAQLASQLVVDALAPTNTVVGNPAVVRRAVETYGTSLLRGARNLVDDVLHHNGMPRKVDRSAFEVGGNLAITPGDVVYRSDLIELVQYRPQTPEVYETPLLFCPAWINKFYIFDLAPDRSLIEWAVQHGHTCFAISYRNPDASMADTSFEDYLFSGPLDAARVVREITRSDSVNTVSVCIGGTLTAIAMAYEAAVGTSDLGAATFINAHTDFQLTGDLGAFTDETTVEILGHKMAQRGYLDSGSMASTFDAIKANDLIFRYLVSSWLMGQDPPPFDMLAWNEDSTRMPARMHTEYLRHCYLRNEFARGVFEVRGTQVHPDEVGVDSFVLSTVDDHIVPWQSAYRTARLLGGHNTFMLSNGGHIAGMVHPPTPRAHHWTNPALPPEPAEWLKDAECHRGTWWEPWTTWIAERSGSRVAARDPGSPSYPPLEPAPGTYVHG